MAGNGWGSVTELLARQVEAERRLLGEMRAKVDLQQARVREASLLLARALSLEVNVPFIEHQNQVSITHSNVVEMEPDNSEE